MALTTRGTCLGKALADSHQKLIADLAIGGELLLAAAIGAGRIKRRPVFDLGGERPRQFQRLVMRLRRKRDDQVEVEAFPVLEFVEGDGLVTGSVLAELRNHGDREG